MLHEGSEILARISEVINYSVCSNQEKKDFMQQKGHKTLLGFIWIPRLEHISKVGFNANLECFVLHQFVIQKLLLVILHFELLALQ